MKSLSEQEFEFTKELQEDRIHMSAVEACMPRCIKHYFTHNLTLAESYCMSKCIEKHLQAGMIINSIYQKYGKALLQGKKNPLSS
mmetsp:Transcript_800/g.1357  ORF Transcript_800/g.1357 Transcript_800/m.1357 type:complete len:85 (-) Transcript_800:22-276(-)